MLARALSRGGRGFAPASVLSRRISSFMASYQAHVEERVAEGVPLPLDAARTAELVALLEQPPEGEEQQLIAMLEDRVPPGVDEAAYIKAGFLAAVSKGDTSSPLLTRQRAVELLGTMQGGYNIGPLIEALDDAELAPTAAAALARTILVFDAFHDVEAKAKAGNAMAQQVMEAWAEAEWFTSRPEVAEKITLTVFKVLGETNTDDLSPAQDAWSRPDIPLHATAMLKHPREGITDAQARTSMPHELSGCSVWG